LSARSPEVPRRRPTHDRQAEHAGSRKYEHERGDEHQPSLTARAPVRANSFEALESPILVVAALRA
jgi:hypothetical protein